MAAASAMRIPCAHASVYCTHRTVLHSLYDMLNVALLLVWTMPPMKRQRHAPTL